MISKYFADVEFLHRLLTANARTLSISWSSSRSIVSVNAVTASGSDATLQLSRYEFAPLGRIFLELQLDYIIFLKKL